MQIHHGKHHQAYITNVNTALEGLDDLAALSVEDLLRNVDQLLSIMVADMPNHSLFWTIMSPNGGGNPTPEVAAAIESACGSLEAAKEQFVTAATTRFGSGWAWVVVDETGSIQIYSTANQDSPIMQGHTPILGLDVWEHAYYLNYQNLRPAYIEAWTNVINWEEVARRYAAAKG
ncbi:Superoxide dismutase [Mn] [Geodia barretti]|uniref:Superoxide dismutase n=1 Tax=Geodia barretti TaxID=519541 RepID=A0AA35S688_GEOBA|nr:Superoxide dismutase [Mn] [Geodia barretti]